MSFQWDNAREALRVKLDVSRRGCRRIRCKVDLCLRFSLRLMYCVAITVRCLKWVTIGRVEPSGVGKFHGERVSGEKGRGGKVRGWFGVCFLAVHCL
jgi:hypothetical protein